MEPRQNQQPNGNKVPNQSTQQEESKGGNAQPQQEESKGPGNHHNETSAFQGEMEQQPEVVGPRHQDSCEGGESEQEEIEDMEDGDGVDKEDFGCKHYLRKCQLQCPDKICEGAFYTCRLCHDEVMYDACFDPKKNHKLERHNVTHVKCLRCGKEQPRGKTCSQCRKDFALYYCSVCSLYDDKAEVRGVFHCDQCGICRAGGRDNFFHCDTCGLCLGLAMKDNHQCVAQRSRQDCPVCLGDLHTQKGDAASFLRCGHSMHTSCFADYVRTNIACPLCKKSLHGGAIQRQINAHYDAEIAAQVMPTEYSNKLMAIQCNDCLVKSHVPFHIVGGKCRECGTYNTTREKGELIEAPMNQDLQQPDTQNSQQNMEDEEDGDGDWEDDDGEDDQQEPEEAKEQPPNAGEEERKE